MEKVEKMENDFGKKGNLLVLSNPQLILAGAGTGKTTMIAQKIIDLLNSGVEQEAILALTFSKEAARNIRKKIEEDLKYGPIPEVNISTFHSFCAQVIRECSENLGVRSDFGVLDETGIAVMIHKLGVEAFDAKRIANTIGKSKDLNISISKFEEYVKELEKQLEAYCKKKEFDAFATNCRIELNTLYLEAKTKKLKNEATEAFLELYNEHSKYFLLVDSWKKVEAEKKKRNALDYGDLNALALEALRKGFAKSFIEGIKYVIIDEFQDTNSVQFELLKLLTSAEGNKGIIAVGDQNQAIYAFRGARTTILDDFKKHYGIKQAENLDKSWRCSNNILEVAHDIISKNYPNPEDCLVVKNANGFDGEPVELINLQTPLDEALFVVEQLNKKIVEEKVSPENILVLYRSHNIANILKEELKRKRIPFTAISRDELVLRPEIKTAIAYLSLLNNTVSDTHTGAISWWRLFHCNNTLDSYDSVKIAKFLKKSRNQEALSLEQVVFEEIPKAGISQKGIQIIEKLKNQIKELRKHLNQPVWKIILEVYEISGLNRAFSATETKEEAECLVNLRELIEIAKEFEENHGKGIVEFIDYLELLDSMGAGSNEKIFVEEKAVRLMSIHGAKGLEAEHVFLIGFSKDKFPLFRGGVEPLIPVELNELMVSQLEGMSKEEKEKQLPKIKKAIKLQEERRLAYVAFTRAKKSLSITHSKTYNDEDREVSEFYKDLNLQGKYITEKAINESQLAQSINPETQEELALRQQKKQLLESLEQNDLNTVIEHAQLYIGLKKGKIPPIENSNAENLEKELEKLKSNQTHFEYPTETIHSVSSLGVYHDCPKKYELSQILHMPSKNDYETGTAIDLGSLFHEIAEQIAELVKNKTAIDEIKVKTPELIKKAKAKEPKFQELDEKKLNELLEIFWKRNETQIKQTMQAEQGFYFEQDGIKFTGLVDRIDKLSPTEVRIIDYKTGKYMTDLVKRNWQLTLYAKAIEKDQKFKDLQARELVLDELQQEKPSWFQIQKNGDCQDLIGRKKAFNINETFNEILETAKSIEHDKKHGFNTTSNDTTCNNCDYKTYCQKWG